MRLLLVEDNEDFRILLSRYLRLRGFVVKEAAEGRDALEVAGEFGPDLVLNDFRMPGVDGIEMFRRLREAPFLLQVPMLICTAEPGAKMDRLAREAGASNVLGKPVDLLAFVERLLQYSGEAEN
ncbi:response regulator [Singulisphaera rosea]